MFDVNEESTHWMQTERESERVEQANDVEKETTVKLGAAKWRDIDRVRTLWQREESCGRGCLRGG